MPSRPELLVNDVPISDEQRADAARLMPGKEQPASSATLVGMGATSPIASPSGVDSTPMTRHLDNSSVSSAKLTTASSPYSTTSNTSGVDATRSTNNYPPVSPNLGFWKQPNRSSLFTNSFVDPTSPQSTSPAPKRTSVFGQPSTTYSPQGTSFLGQFSFNVSGNSANNGGGGFAVGGDNKKAFNESVRKLDEELNKIISNFNNSYTHSAPPPHSTTTNHHHQPSSTFQTLHSAGDNTEPSLTLRSTNPGTTTPPLTGSVHHQVTGSNYGTKIGNIFSSVTSFPTGTHDLNNSNFSRACAAVHSLLTKHHRKVNGFLPSRRRVLAFLYVPFSARPFVEGNCRLSLNVIQVIISDYTLDTQPQVTQLLSWCLAAFHCPSLTTKLNTLERIQYLLSLSQRKTELGLSSSQLLEMGTLLVQFISNSDLQTAFNHLDQDLQEKAEQLLLRLCNERDQKVAEQEGGFTHHLVLAVTMGFPSSPVLNYSLKKLEKVDWPNPQDSKATPFYQSFINSSHAILGNFLTNPHFQQDDVAYRILILIHQNFQPKQHPLLDNLTWSIVTRCSLLAFGLGSLANDSVTFAQHLDTRSRAIRSSKAHLQTLADQGLEEIIIHNMSNLLSQCHLTVAVAIYGALVLNSASNMFSFKDKLLQTTLPILYDRLPTLQADAAGINLEPVQNFLLDLKSLDPHGFYRPLLQLIGTKGDLEVSTSCRLMSWLKVLNHAVTPVSMLLSELDLIAVIIFTPNCTLGQIIFLDQVILAIHSLRTCHPDLVHQPHHLLALKLVVDLERQITMLLLAREKLNQPPLPYPILHLVLRLLTEIRHCTQPKKRPGWLNIILRYTQAIHQDEVRYTNEIAAVKEKLSALSGYNSGVNNRNSSDTEIETPSLPMVLYRDENNLNYKISSSCKSNDVIASNPFDESYRTLVSMLLAAVYFYLTDDEMMLLLPMLYDWELKSQPHPGAQLLILLAGERMNDQVDMFLHNQIKSRPNHNQLLSRLFGSRRTLIQHLRVVDPTEKPFRRVGPNLTFVSAMVGTYEPVVQESRWLEKLKLSGTSLEEIKMIQSLGWDADDDEEDEEEEFDHHLLPSDHPDDHNPSNTNEGGEDSTNAGLDGLERWRGGNHSVTLSSTTFEEIYQSEAPSFNDETMSGQVKRKPLLPPSLGGILLKLTSELSLNATYQPAEYHPAKNHILTYVLRDEPSWYLRLLFQELSDPNTLEHRLNEINYLITTQPNLPLQFTYHTFNYLAGWLKYLYRESMIDDLSIIGKVLPLLARIVPSTHEVTYRELKKGKLEAGLLYDGRLTLPEPNSFFRIPQSQFLNSLCARDQLVVLDHLPRPLFDMGLLRIGQSLFMSRLLNRNPHDVSSIARSLHPFEPLPSLFSQPKYCQLLRNELDWLPPTLAFQSFSALHCHAWLGFLENLFNGIDPNYQDRAGLHVLIEGINQILLAHPHHLPLLARCVRLLVRIALQFRRLFNIKSGYSLFIESLFKVYHATHLNPEAQAGIKFAIALFFNLHRDSFVFQMVGALVPMILDYQGTDEIESWCHALYDWFSSLEKLPGDDQFMIVASLPAKLTTLTFSIPTNSDDPQAHPPPKKAMSNPTVHGSAGGAVGLVKPAGIKQFLAKHAKPLHHEGSITDFKHFTVADTLRLFVTMIAYDPSSLRSEQFVVILQYLVPYFMKSISASDLLDLAIKSIIPVFVRFSRSKSLLTRLITRTTNNLHHATRFTYTNNAIEEEVLTNSKKKKINAKEKAAKDDDDDDDDMGDDGNWPQNDRVTIRIHLFKLVGSLLEVGGELSLTQYDELLYILRSIIKANQPSVNHNPQAEGALVMFYKWVILPTRDLSIQQNLMVKALTMIQLIMNQHCTLPSNAADLVNGANLIANSHYVTSSSGVELRNLLPNYLVYGMHAMTQQSENPEGALVIGQALVRFISRMVYLHPQATLTELRRIPTNTLTLAYLLVPLCSQLPLQEHQLSHRPQALSLASHCWAILLSLLTSPITLASLPLSSDHHHPLNTSLSFLLGLVGIKLIMVQVPELLFQRNPLLTHQLAQLLQRHIFDSLPGSSNPVSSRTHSASTSAIPTPVRSYAAWRLATYWAASHQSTFLPLFRTTLRLLHDSIKAPQARSPSPSTNPNQLHVVIPVTLSRSNSSELVTRQFSNNSPTNNPSSPVAEELGELNPPSSNILRGTSSLSLGGGGFRFSKRVSSTKPNILINNNSNNTSHANLNPSASSLTSGGANNPAIMSTFLNVSTNHVLTQLELQTYHLQVTPIAQGSYSAPRQVSGSPQDFNSDLELSPASGFGLSPFHDATKLAVPNNSTSANSSLKFPSRPHSPTSSGGSATPHPTSHLSPPAVTHNNPAPLSGVGSEPQQLNSRASSPAPSSRNFSPGGGLGEQSSKLPAPQLSIASHMDKEWHFLLTTFNLPIPPSPSTIKVPKKSK